MEWFQAWWQGLGIVGQVMACCAIPMTVILLLQLVLMLIGIGGGSDSDTDGDGSGADTDADGDGSFDHDFGHGFAHDVGHDFGHDFGHDAGHDFDHDFDHDAGFDPGHEFDHDFSHELGHGHDNVHYHDHGRSNHDSARIITIRGIVAFFALGGWAGLAALSAGIKPLWSIQIALLSGVAAMLLASFAIRFALRMQSSGNIYLGNAISHTADVYITIPPLRSNTGKVTMLVQERFTEIDAVTDSDMALKPGTKVKVIGLAGQDCVVVRPLNEQDVQDVDEDETDK